MQVAGNIVVPINSLPLPAMILAVAEARVIDANTAFLCMGNYKLEQLQGRTMEELAILPHLDRIIALLCETTAGQPFQPALTRLKTAFDRDIDVQVWLQRTCLHEDDVFLLLFQDVIELRVTHDALKRSESRLQSLTRDVPGAVVGFTDYNSPEAALDTTEFRFPDLLKHLPDTIMVFDRQARHLFVNGPVREETGMDPAAFIGKTHLELGFPPEQCRFWEKQIELAFATGKPQEVEFELSILRPMILNWRLFPLSGPDGVDSVFAISRNVTDMRRAQRQYETLFSEMLDGFAVHEIICDNSGKPVDYRFVSVNPAFERITGLKAADIAGRTAREVLPNIDLVWIERYGKVALTGEPISFDEYSTPLDTYYHVRVFRPESGRFACLFEDITDRKRAEIILHARFKISMASAVGEDVASALRQMCEGVCGLPGVEAGSAYCFNSRGKMLIAVYHHGVSPAFENAVSFFGPDTPLLALINAGKPVIRHFRDVQNLFEPICAREGLQAVAMLPIIFQGETYGAIFLATKTRPAFCDETLQAFNAVLPEITAAMRRLAIEHNLRKALLEAESASRAKNGFLSVISHEVRTPLNAILGFTELALDTSLTEEQRRFLDIVKRRGNDLLGILNDILDIARLDSGVETSDAGVFDFRQMLKNTCDYFAMEAEKKNLKFSCDLAQEIPALLVGHKVRLKQVLFNLLGNALKFTEHGSISLSTELAAGEQPEDALLILVTIADTGIGIPKEKRKCIFELFIQADDSSTRRYGGAGLGLAVVQRMLALMGGSVWCESEVGKGSKFFFTVPLGLPVKDAVIPAKPEENIAAVAMRRFSVLVVDDDEASRILALRIIDGLGHDVSLAADGTEAIEKCKTNDFDVIFLDVRMPLLDGLETTRRIRKSDSGVRNHNVPIIAMTANAMKGDDEICFASGMSDYVAKPVTAEAIRCALARVLCA